MTTLAIVALILDAERAAIRNPSMTNTRDFDRMPSWRLDEIAEAYSFISADWQSGESRWRFPINRDSSRQARRQKTPMQNKT